MIRQLVCTAIVVSVFISTSVTLAVPNGSIFKANISWKDDQGKPVHLKSFKGTWTVISMMYTTCPSSCPLIVKKMRKVESVIQAKGFKSEFVLVTFDPERDTSAKLTLHRQKIGVTEPHWHFLNGSIADTRQLSMLLGIKYAKDTESGEFMHDNKIILLSPEGEIVARLESLGDNENEFVDKMTNGEQ